MTNDIHTLSLLIDAFILLSHVPTDEDRRILNPAEQQFKLGFLAPTATLQLHCKGFRGQPHCRLALASVPPAFKQPEVT